MYTLLKLAALALALGGCQKSSDAPKPPALENPSKCAWDEDCVKPGYVCMYESCVKGKRSESEKAAIAAQRQADIEAAAKKAKEEAPPGPNEGRLLFRVCPFFERTSQSVARVTAKNTASGEVFTLDLDKLIRVGELRSEFAFKKLPIGEYEATIEYGVMVGSTRDMAQLSCDKKAKPCKDKRVRLFTVTPASQEAPPALDENGKPVKKPCDWVAE